MQIQGKRSTPYLFPFSLDKLQQGGASGIRSYGGGGISNSGGILGRPASVAAGYSDLILPSYGAGIGGITSGGQLSRELDRLHREQEVMRGQLETADRSVRQFKQEAETARSEATRLKEDLQHQRELMREMEDNLQAREEESVSSYT